MTSPTCITFAVLIIVGCRRIVPVGVGMGSSWRGAKATGSVVAFQGAIDGFNEFTVKSGKSFRAVTTIKVVIAAFTAIRTKVNLIFQLCTNGR